VHLAQLNIGRTLAPLDSLQLAGFVANLERVNALADAAPGFVWRLQDDSGDATSIRAFEDELMILNMSVWESLEALWAYVYDGEHLAVMRRRREWFERIEQHMCLWWAEEGRIPTVAEAIGRLEELRAVGPSPRSFTFKRPFDEHGAAVDPGALRPLAGCA